LAAAEPTRILVIEDEDTVRDLVRRVLEKAGYHVTTAPDGQAGFEKALEEPFDLVVSDLLTPRMHGYEVIQRLKATASTRRIPVVVLSAKAYPADQRKALEMGAAAFLPKPFRAPALLEVVSNVLTTLRVRFWGCGAPSPRPAPRPCATAATPRA